MRKHISLLAVLVLVCLIVVPNMVSAAEDEETIFDGQNDVIDYQANDLVTESPDIDIENLDIQQAELTISGQQATVTLKVYGDIENRGSLDDFLGDMSEEFDINTVAYSFSVATTVDAYELMYVNNKAFLLFGDGLEQKNITGDSISVSGDTLTIVFDLSTSEETIDFYTVSSQYLKFSFDVNADPEDYDELFVYIGDIAPNEDLAIYYEVTNIAEVGKTVEFNGSVDPLTGQPPFTYTWEFGDGASATTKDATHTYSNTGTYEYSFTVKDASGAEVSETGTIEITGDGGSNEDTPILLFIAVIVIIAIIGVAVLIFVIRR